MTDKCLPPMVESSTMRRDEILMMPSSLPYTMSWEEAVQWLAGHSVRIVDVCDE